MSSNERAMQASMEMTGLYGQDLEDFIDSMRATSPVDKEAEISMEREVGIQGLGASAVQGACADIHDHPGFYAEYER